MKGFNLRAINFGRPLIFLLLLCLNSSLPAFGQRQFSVSVESKTLNKGKASVVNKDLFYRVDGNLTARYNAHGEEYYTLSSAFGFTSVYYPASKETTTLPVELYKPEDELLYLFANGSGEDLGMKRFGFELKRTKKDGNHIVRRYEPKEKGSKTAWVELVLDQQYLPVYCAYYDKKGKLITKTYLSGYTQAGAFVFPLRVTEITYMAEKNDSTIRLDIYKNLQVDTPNEMFNFHIPSDAKIVDLKEALKSFSK